MAQLHKLDFTLVELTGTEITISLRSWLSTSLMEAREISRNLWGEVKSNFPDVDTLCCNPHIEATDPLRV